MIFLSFNEAADFRWNDIGGNVIPINSIKKETHVKWSKFEENSISEEQHNTWKTKGAFNNGIAIMAGKLWLGKYKGKYLACIDIDNKKGIEEFLSHFGKVDTVEKFARINRNKDNSNLKRDCTNSDLLLHYQFYSSNRNVLCEYFQESNSYVYEPQTIESDLFNYNFCPYCSIEFWVKYGEKL